MAQEATLSFDSAQPGHSGLHLSQTPHHEIYEEDLQQNAQQSATGRPPGAALAVGEQPVQVRRISSPPLLELDDSVAHACSNPILDDFDFDSFLRSEFVAYTKHDGPVLQQALEREKGKQGVWLHDQMVFTFPVSAFFKTRMVQGVLIALALFSFAELYFAAVAVSQTVSGMRFRLTTRELRGNGEVSTGNPLRQVGITSSTCLMTPAEIETDDAGVTTMTFSEVVTADGWWFRTTGEDAGLDAVRIWVEVADTHTSSFRRVERDYTVARDWRVRVPLERDAVVRLSYPPPQALIINDVVANMVTGGMLTVACVFCIKERIALGRRVVMLTIIIVGLLYLASAVALSASGDAYMTGQLWTWAIVMLFFVFPCMHVPALERYFAPCLALAGVVGMAEFFIETKPHADVPLRMVYIYIVFTVLGLVMWAGARWRRFEFNRRVKDAAFRIEAAWQSAFGDGQEEHSRQLRLLTDSCTALADRCSTIPPLQPRPLARRASLAESSQSPSGSTLRSELTWDSFSMTGSAGSMPGSIVHGDQPTRRLIPAQPRSHSPREASQQRQSKLEASRVSKRLARAQSAASLATTLDQLYAQARCCSVILRAKAAEVADETAGMFRVSARKATPADPDVEFVRWCDVKAEPLARGEVLWEPLKPPDKAITKVLHRYGGNCRRLLDVCRETVVFECAADMAACVDTLAQDSEVVVERIRNRMTASRDEGLPSVVLNLRIDSELTRALCVDTHVCELILVLDAFTRLVSAESHADYLQLRGMRSVHTAASFSPERARQEAARSMERRRSSILDAFNSRGSVSTDNGHSNHRLSIEPLAGPGTPGSISSPDSRSWSPPRRRERGGQPRTASPSHRPSSPGDARSQSPPQVRAEGAEAAAPTFYQRKRRAEMWPDSPSAGSPGAGGGAERKEAPWGPASGEREDGGEREGLQDWDGSGSAAVSGTFAWGDAVVGHEGSREGREEKERRAVGLGTGERRNSVRFNDGAGEGARRELQPPKSIRSHVNRGLKRPTVVVGERPAVSDADLAAQSAKVVSPIIRARSWEGEPEVAEAPSAYGGFLGGASHAGAIRAVGPGGQLDLDQVFFQQCQSRNIGKAWLVMKKGRGITEANRFSRTVSVLSTSFPLTAAMSKPWFARVVLVIGLALAATMCSEGADMLTTHAIHPQIITWGDTNRGFECGYLRFTALQLRGGQSTEEDGPLVSDFGLVPACGLNVTSSSITRGQNQLVVHVPCASGTKYSGFYFTTNNATPSLDPVTFQLEASEDMRSWDLLSASGRYLTRTTKLVLYNGSYPVPDRRQAKVSVSFNPQRTYKLIDTFGQLQMTLGFLCVWCAHVVGRVQLGKPLVVLTFATQCLVLAVMSIMVHIDMLYRVMNFDWLVCVQLGIVTYVLQCVEGRLIEGIIFGGAGQALTSFGRDLVEDQAPLASFTRPKISAWTLLGFGLGLWVLRWRQENAALKKIQPDKEQYDKVWEGLLQDEREKAAMDRIVRTLQRKGGGKWVAMRPRQMYCSMKGGISSLANAPAAHESSVRVSVSTLVRSPIPRGSPNSRGSPNPRGSRWEKEHEVVVGSRKSSASSANTANLDVSIRTAPVSSAHDSPISKSPIASVQTQRPSSVRTSRLNALAAGRSAASLARAQNRLQKRLTVPAGLENQQAVSARAPLHRNRSQTNSSPRVPSRLRGHFHGRGEGLRLSLGASSPLRFKPQRPASMHRVMVDSLDLLYMQAAVVLPILNFKVCELARSFRGRFPICVREEPSSGLREISLDDSLSPLRVSRERSAKELQYPLWEEVEGDETLEQLVRWPGLKRPERAIEKMMRSYGGHAWMILDIARHSLVFELANELHRCLEAILDDPDIVVLAVKNRLRADYNSKATAGYRDVLLNVTLATPEARELGVDSFVCEIQLHLLPFASLKNDGGHRRYVEFRNERAQ